MALLPPTGETSALEDDAAAHAYTHSNPSQVPWKWRVIST